MQNKVKVYNAVVGGLEHYNFTQGEIDLLVACGHVFISKSFPDFGSEIYLCSPIACEYFLREVISKVTELIDKKDEADCKKPNLYDTFKKVEEMLNSPSDLFEYRSSVYLLLSQIQTLYKAYKKQKELWRESLFKS